MGGTSSIYYIASTIPVGLELAFPAAAAPAAIAGACITAVAALGLIGYGVYKSIKRSNENKDNDADNDADKED